MGNQSLEQRAGLGVETGIRVYFDEVDLHVLIDDEVISEHFELVHRLVLTLRWIQVVIRLQVDPECFKGVLYSLLDLGEDNFFKVHLLRVPEVLLEVLERDFVTWFVFTVVIAVHLDSIISEMDISVCQIIVVECIATGSDVALLVVVASEMASFNDLSQGKHSDVKLSERRIEPGRASYEERVSDIELYHPVLIWSCSLEELLNSRKVGQDYDTSASI